MRRSSSHTVLLLIILTNYAWLLPSPIGLSIDSVNMRHIVNWSPLQARCSTALLYSTQFQGEFELLNGSWEDAPECQRIPRTECDLTHDLGSDADYNIRVRGHCGRLVSPWATLSGPFNRRDTALTVLEMSVTVMGGGLQVSFTELPHHAALNMSISIWKKGQQLQEAEAAPQVITVNHSPLHITSLQEGAVYCIQASIHLYLKHSSNDKQCVTITSPGVSWVSRVTHITVSVTVVLMAGLLLAVFWSLVHCNPEACQSYFSKEPLPSSLQIDCHIQRLVSHVEEELYEPIHRIIPFKPPQQTAELTEEASMNSSGEIRPMLPKTQLVDGK